MNACSPGLPKGNPGLELANAFSVVSRTLSFHTIWLAGGSGDCQLPIFNWRLVIKPIGKSEIEHREIQTHPAKSRVVFHFQPRGTTQQGSKKILQPVDKVRYQLGLF
jgi:hypothetical protein